MGLTGGCMCGAVRYELESDPFDCGWCHCRTCQLTAARRPWSSPASRAAISSGPSGAEKVKSVKSSSFGHREFCGECGTPLPNEGRSPAGNGRLQRRHARRARARSRPDFISSGEARSPGSTPATIYPRHDKFRPDTRGLEGTEPPAIQRQAAEMMMRLPRVAFEPLLDLAARRGADLLRDRLAALEQQHGRDSAHAVAARDVRILVDVELGDGHLVAELARRFPRAPARSSGRARTIPPRNRRELDPRNPRTSVAKLWSVTVLVAMAGESPAEVKS